VWWRLRRSEFTLIAFFSYVAIVALFFPLPSGLKFAGFAVAGSVIVACVGLADCERRSGSRVFSIVRDWLPIAFTLTAYREMNWFATVHTAHTLEHAWIVWDRWLLDDWGMRALVEISGWIGPVFLELCYLFVYAIGPFTVGILYGYKRRDLVDAVLTTYLCGTLLAYALFPYFPSDPPRVVFANMDLPGMMTPVRRLNLAIVGGYGIHSSVFPSAHVSSAFSAAWGLLLLFREKRRVGWGMLVYAGCVSSATVYGRYHYATDAAAGIVISAAALLVAFVLSRRVGLKEQC
jgi:membrane-associated phospholipid phosphatase